MRFVKVTDAGSNKTTYLNLDYVKTLWWEPDNQRTVIRFSSTEYTYVKESPEEILIKLPVIGG